MATEDKYKKVITGTEAPGFRHFSITPGTGDLTALPRALYVGTAGDLVVEDSDGVSVTYVGISGFVPMRAAKVLSTGTTATDIVGIY